MILSEDFLTFAADDRLVSQYDNDYLRVLLNPTLSMDYVNMVRIFI